MVTFFVVSDMCVISDNDKDQLKSRVTMWYFVGFNRHALWEKITDDFLRSPYQHLLHTVANVALNSIMVILLHQSFVRKGKLWPFHQAECGYFRNDIWYRQWWNCSQYDISVSMFHTHGRLYQPMKHWLGTNASLKFMHLAKLDDTSSFGSLIHDHDDSMVKWTYRRVSSQYKTHHFRYMDDKYIMVWDHVMSIMGIPVKIRRVLILKKHQNPTENELLWPKLRGSWVNTELKISGWFEMSYIWPAF